MDKKKKIILGVGLGLVAAVGAYFAITKFMKPKEEEQPEEDKKPEDTTPVKKLAPSSPITVKKAAPKGLGFEPPKAGPVITKGGKKLVVFASSNNTKVFKQTPKGGIGSLYNTYNKGQVIGDYTGHTSIGGVKFLTVNDAGSKLIVSSKLVYQKTI